MDRRELLDRAAQSAEERILLGQVWDRYDRCRQRNLPAATGFLSPREQAACERLLQALGVREGYVFYGGYESAERRQLHFLPDWLAGPEEDAIAALRCTFYQGESPSHRDFLGSLMGLGLTRRTVGDILVSENSADVLVSGSVASFLLEQWEAAGRVRLRVKAITLSELAVPEEHTRERTDTVPSLRLDCLVASGFGTSRKKAAEAIAAGRVEVNWTVCQKADHLLRQGDVLTVRGLGKCKLETVGPQTRKGRTCVSWKQYV